MLKYLLFFAGLPLVPLLSAGDTGGFFVDKTTPLAALQQANERFLARYKSKFSWQDYLALIDELADTKRYKVIAGEDFSTVSAPDKVVVYFRHDMDLAPFHGVKMSREEKKRNLRGSYYVLHSARYYGTKKPGKMIRYAAMDALWKEIRDNGHEIGIHNDLFSMQLTNGIDPVKFQAAELAYYRAAGLPVTGTVCHGGVINAWGLNNTWIFSDFRKKGAYTHKGKVYKYGERSVKDFGFTYEGYRLRCNVRLSDISKYDASGLLKRLKACKPGDKVSLLLHPCHWRKDASVSGKK
ncbi:MAG: hypothetical protein IKC65_06570 [Lentisphaeria bacterium]|nr:hypothetical protein [Lentisphaeria bacterium]